MNTENINNTYVETINAQSAIVWSNCLKRNGAFPLDRTDLFDSYDDALLYAGGAKAPDVKEEINTISPIVPTQVQPTNIETVKDVIAEPTENVEEQEEIEEEPEIEEPKVVEELTMVPLDTSAEYRPKMVPSGIITKPASSKKVQQTETDEVKDAPVLRPISTTDEVFSSGTIVKKK